jgi:hypothetical protein
MLISIRCELLAMLIELEMRPHLIADITQVFIDGKIVSSAAVLHWLHAA